MPPCSPLGSLPRSPSRLTRSSSTVPTTTSRSGWHAALGTPTFTIEVRFKRTGAGTTTSTGVGGLTATPLIAKGRGEADGSTVDANYFLGIDGASHLCADYEEGAGQASPGQNHPVIGSTTITDNVWHHGAATFDGTTWRLYLDGDLEATLRSAPGGCHSGEHPARVARHHAQLHGNAGRVFPRPA